MLILSPALAQAQAKAPVCPQSSPLTEAQVTQMVRIKVTPSVITGPVKACGIAFDPTQEAIEGLQSAGATDDVLAAVKAADGPTKREQAAWEAIGGSTDQAKLEAFLKQYPDGKNAQGAKRRVRNLKIDAVSLDVRSALDAQQWDKAEELIAQFKPIGDSPDEDRIKDWKQEIDHGKKPVISDFTADPRSVPRGQSAMLSWKLNGGIVTGVSIEPGPGPIGADAPPELKVTPADDVTYTLTVIGPGGSVTAKFSLRVTDPEPGTTKDNPKDGLTYVWIPPGTFQMGCSKGDTQCSPDGNEKPAHLVTISKGFWMGQTEVTQDAFSRVTGQSPGNFEGGQLPVNQVRFDDAQAYCQAVGMRLPTEAEWEYAARAGDTSARYGDVDSVAWYVSRSASRTHQVGQKAPNKFGLYDMLGNVSEWVSDFYGPYSPGAQTDPQTTAGEKRIARGGSWEFGAEEARASARFTPTDGSKRSLGLRCVGR